MYTQNCTLLPAESRGAHSAAKLSQLQDYSLIKNVVNSSDTVCIEETNTVSRRACHLNTQ